MTLDDCGCRLRSPAESDPPAATPSADARYISFVGLDCDGRARRVMACIDQHLTHPGRRTAFWDYFQAKRQPRSGPPPDDLMLIHASINQVRELFETWDDTPALALLDDLEVNCC